VSRSPLRVCVVDDHSLFAQTLVIGLRADGVLAQCVAVDGQMTLAQLERAITQHDPDVVLLDLGLGIPGDVMVLVQGLAAAGISVVVVTGAADPPRAGAALCHGACAVIAKSEPFSEVMATVQRIRCGRPAMSEKEHARLVQDFQETDVAREELRRRFDLMSRREAEVLGLLMGGMTVHEIARSRFVSESTVRSQVKAILSKLDVGSQLTAVGRAHQIGWRPPTRDEGLSGSARLPGAGATPTA
jgi:two-component system nitrate/nitrite response regulator NarL